MDRTQWLGPSNYSKTWVIKLKDIIERICFLILKIVLIPIEACPNHYSNIEKWHALRSGTHPLM